MDADGQSPRGLENRPNNPMAKEAMPHSKSKGAAQATEHAAMAAAPAVMAPATARFAIGDAVLVKLKASIGGGKGPCEGTVRFCGPTNFAEGEWIEGVECFDCRPEHWLFLRDSEAITEAITRAAAKGPGARSVRDLVGSDDVMAIIVGFVGGGHRYGPVVSFTHEVQLTLLVPGLTVRNRLDFGAQGPKHLAAAGVFVTTLTLDCVNFNFAFIALKANTSVKSVILRRCRLLEEEDELKGGCGHTRLLADALATNTSLKKLVFSQCSFFSSSTTDNVRSRQLLRNAFAGNKGLRSLTFKGCSVSTHENDEWDIGMGISHNTTLREFHVDNDHMHHYGEWCVQGPDSLEVLSLSMCKQFVHMGGNLRRLLINNSMCNAMLFLNKCGQFNRIKEVALIACDLAAWASSMLAELLLVGTTLTGLDVSNNPRLGGNMTQMLHALEINAVLKALDVCDCSLTKHDCHLLVKACHANSTLTHLGMTLVTQDDGIEDASAGAQDVVNLIASLLGANSAPRPIEEVQRDLRRSLDGLQLARFRRRVLHVDGARVDEADLDRLAHDIGNLLAAAGDERVGRIIQALDAGDFVQRTFADLLDGLAPQSPEQLAFAAFNKQTLRSLARNLILAGPGHVAKLQLLVDVHVAANPAHTTHPRPPCRSDYQSASATPP